MAMQDFKKDSEQDSGEEVYSKSVRAGRRTYFFDVKATRNDDYYLTITESRKRQGKDGEFFFDKHKIYLYKEDFSKFASGLEEVINFVKKSKPEFFEAETAGIGVAGDSVSDIDEEFDKL